MLWIATFQDVARYMRERMHGSVHSWVRDDVILVVLRDDLTDARYDLPLTLKTWAPPDWATADVRQGRRAQRVPVVKTDGRSLVLYEAIRTGRMSVSPVPRRHALERPHLDRDVVDSPQHHPCRTSGGRAE